MKMKTTLMLTFAASAMTASATLLAVDDFSSLDGSGGTGFAGTWSAGTYANTTPFSDAVSPEYMIGAYSTRSLTTPLLATTTAEVWVAGYIRPQSNAGWQFGFEVGQDMGLGTAAGAQIGRLTGNGQYGGARTNAEDITRISDTFVDGQATLLLVRLYKANPGDTEYNRADFFADLNGTDGRANNLVTITTGKDLSNRSTASVSEIRLLVDGNTTDFDYIAVGTDQASVLIVPEPSSAALLGLGGLALILRRRK
ncbi:MAG: PEP-CTERM sorting domain-containing protein [Akkermansiaceae bacterium]|nr:PEP-CTERM sorting domain-containing protein [Akkermansiaceae bacterium]